MKVLILCTIMAATPVLAQDANALLTLAANRHGIDPAIVHAIAEVESGKRCGLKDGPHRGIMQVSRGAAEEVGMAWPPRSCEDEIETGIRYLELALKRGGIGCQGVTLYNTGINARPHCSGYGQKVMREKRK
jgi:soluble lytic murein transglycosylase-like protein